MGRVASKYVLILSSANTISFYASHALTRDGGRIREASVREIHTPLCRLFL